MPNTKSAKKRLRQNVARRLRNRGVRSAMRTQIRRVREAVSEGNLDVAESQFRLAAKRLDQAGAKGIIHPNKAARTKSRLQSLIKSAKAAD